MNLAVVGVGFVMVKPVGVPGNVHVVAETLVLCADSPPLFVIEYL